LRSDDEAIDKSWGREEGTRRDKSVLKVKLGGKVKGKTSGELLVHVVEVKVTRHPEKTKHLTCNST
jgi:hypothetical protein